MPHLAAIEVGTTFDYHRLMEKRVQASGNEVVRGRKREFLAFLFLTVALAPVVAVAVVGGYGFSVWMYQIIVGPPGPS